MDESGPFGKSRRGRTRTKHTPTVNKEDPHIAYFGEVLKNDLGKSGPKDQSPPKKSRSRSSSQSNVYNATASGGLTVTVGTTAPAIATPALHIQKEPTEVILYGFKSTQQYAAIDRFEKLSGGYICEDYPRDSPMAFNKFRTIASYPAPRTLTPEERRKANVYRGGEHWIKITFNSTQAAERALEAAPLEIKGFLVHAELYRGQSPHRDEPLPVRQEGSDVVGLSEPRSTDEVPIHLSSGFLSSSTAGPSDEDSRRASTLPRSFSMVPAPSSNANHQATSSFSPSTASSATVTGYATSGAPRNGTYRGPSLAETAEVEVCRGIPTARRVKLRPAEEAVLPRRGTFEVLLSYIPFSDFFRNPKFVDQIPKFDDGRFDYARATLYWKVCFWLDRIFQTDLCGLKDE